jgi:peptide/nickel transport system substrate-binding protein
MFHRSALDRGGTGTWYTTDEITNILDEARVTVDKEERLSMYKQVQRKIHEAYPTIPVGEYKVFYPTQSNLKGFTFRGLDGKEVQFHDYHKTG